MSGAVDGQSTAQDIVTNGIPAANLRVVYNGVDLDHFRPAPPGSKTVQPSVLWVGRVRKTKCVTHVVDAFEIVARKLPTATLTIVGQGDFEAELSAALVAAAVAIWVVIKSKFGGHD